MRLRTAGQPRFARPADAGPGPYGGSSLIAIACATLLAACSSAKPPVLIARPPPPVSSVARLPPGSSVAVRRPTPGVARIALWLDAGAREASPPQLATAAAWWAAQRAGAEARVLPDGTEISVLCDTQREHAAGCVNRLLRALSAPAPGGTDVQRLRERLKATRLRAATDPLRHADSRALEALLGESALALAPLGRDADDAAVDAGRIARFAASSFTKARALLIAAGDLDQAELEASFARAQSASGSSAPGAAAAPLALRSSLLVEAADENLIALALATPSAGQAAAIAEGLRHLYPHAQVRASSLRGLNLLNVRMPAGNTPTRRLQRAVFDLRRLALEANEPVVPAPEESLENIVRQLGESWVTRGESAAVALPHPWPLGAVLLVRDSATPADDGRARLERLNEEAKAAVAAAEANSQGNFQGDTDAASARVHADNGTRIEIVRRPGERWFAGLVRFRGGSALDPPTRHGRAALLASLMADGCGFASAGALDARLSSIDASIAPLVDAQGFGVLMTAPSAHGEQALDMLLRCAVRPALTTRAMEDARLKLTRVLWTRSEQRLHAALGHLLAPLAPGSVAPWGAPYGISAVQIGELRRLHAEAASGARTEVLVIADADPAQLARFVARRISQLPRGNAAPVQPDPGPVPAIRGEATEAGALRAIVGIRSERAEAPPGSLAPATFAAALARALEARAGRAVWSWGDASQRLALSGVGLALSESELAGLEAHTRAALQELAARSDASWKAELEQARLAESARMSSAHGYAALSFHAAPTARWSVDDELARVRRLSREQPAFFVLRPKP